MAGGLLQLVANGEQDIYITGNPQITFFKVVYRKITPFTIESIKQSYIGTVNPGNKVTVDIERQGDLLSRVWLNIIHKKIEPVTQTGINYPTSHYFKEFTENDLGNNYNNDLVVSNSGFVNLTYSSEIPIENTDFKSISINISDLNQNNLIPLHIPYTISFPELYSNEFTVSMHIKIKANTGTRAQTILSTLDTDNNTGYRVSILPNRRLEFSIGNGSSIESFTTDENSINDDLWYFILVSNTTLYYRENNNGTNTSTYSPNGSYVASTKDIYICRDQGEDENYFIGSLSDLRFYNENVSNSNETIRRTPIESVGLDDQQSRTDIYRDIEFVECEIGGQIIDKQYGEWMMIWTDLTNNTDKTNILSSLDTENSTYIPLQFWFCRNPGLALPLIALQYHEVKLHIQFSNSLRNDSLLEVYCDYVFLDEDERRRFAEESHEYLIENVQTLPLHPLGNLSGNSKQTSQVKLAFNHPIKEIFWTVKNKDDVGLTIDDAVIQINGYDRFNRRSGKYFTQVQRYQYHGGSNNSSLLVPHIYSFAENPEEYQPSGTCNFSMINDAKLNFNYTKPDLIDGDLFARVYGLGYNLLRIISGMGGLAYAN